MWGSGFSSACHRGASRPELRSCAWVVHGPLGRHSQDNTDTRSRGPEWRWKLSFICSYIPLQSCQAMTWLGEKKGASSRVILKAEGGTQKLVTHLGTTDSKRRNRRCSPFQQGWNPRWALLQYPAGEERVPDGGKGPCLFHSAQTSIQIFLEFHTYSQKSNFTLQDFLQKTVFSS